MNIQDINNYFTVLHPDQQNDAAEKWINNQQFLPQTLELYNYQFLPFVPFANFPLQGYQNQLQFPGLSQNDLIEIKQEPKTENFVDKDMVQPKSKKQKFEHQSLLPKTAESEKRIHQEESVSHISDINPLQSNRREINQHLIPQNFLQDQLVQSCYWMIPQPPPKLSSNVFAVNEQGNIGKSNNQLGALKKPKKPHINTGHWSAEEHVTYTQFLEQFESVMTSSMMKKSSKIFKQMADKIGTRTPSQCRSHHQKFNPYASKNNNRRLLNGERGKAGRKKKTLDINLSSLQQQTALPLIPPTQEQINAYSMIQNQQFQQFWSSPQFQNPFHQYQQIHSDIVNEEINLINCADGPIIDIDVQRNQEDAHKDIDISNDQQLIKSQHENLDQFFKIQRFNHQISKKILQENNEWIVDDIKKDKNQ